MSKKILLCVALLFTALASNSVMACDGHEHHQCKGKDCEHTKTEKKSLPATIDDKSDD